MSAGPPRRAAFTHPRRRPRRAARGGVSGARHRWPAGDRLEPRGGAKKIVLVQHSRRALNRGVHVTGNHAVPLPKLICVRIENSGELGSVRRTVLGVGPHSQKHELQRGCRVTDGRGQNPWQGRVGNYGVGNPRCPAEKPTPLDADGLGALHRAVMLVRRLKAVSALHSWTVSTSALIASTTSSLWSNADRQFHVAMRTTGPVSANRGCEVFPRAGQPYGSRIRHGKWKNSLAKQSGKLPNGQLAEVFVRQPEASERCRGNETPGETNPDETE